MNESPKDYYSSIAAGYDELHGAEQDEKLHEFLHRASIAPHAKLLDVGCGTGRSARELLQRVPGLEWHGIEPSEGLIQHAGTEARSRITHGRGEALPWSDATFDVVLSLTALQNYDDPVKGLEEMRRVTKPGGLLLISFLKKSPKREVLDRAIRERLRVELSWEQSKDLMYVCRP